MFVHILLYWQSTTFVHIPYVGVKNADLELFKIKGKNTHQSKY